MTKERKGELALEYLKYRATQEKIQFAYLKRELGNAAKARTIPREELMEFGRIVIEEVLGEVLGGK